MQAVVQVPHPEDVLRGHHVRQGGPPVPAPGCRARHPLHVWGQGPGACAQGGPRDRGGGGVAKVAPPQDLRVVVVALCLIARVLACEGRVRGAGWEVGSSTLAPLDFSAGPSISRLRQDWARTWVLLTRAGLGQPCVCTQNIPKGTADGDPARALTRGQVGADKAHTGVVQPHSDGHRACRGEGQPLDFCLHGSARAVQTPQR